MGTGIDPGCFMLHEVEHILVSGILSSLLGPTLPGIWQQPYDHDLQAFLAVMHCLDVVLGIVGRGLSKLHTASALTKPTEAN